MHQRRKYATLLLTIFMTWLPANILPLDCCCNGQSVVEMGMSKGASKSGCNEKTSKKTKAGKEVEHCPMSEANPIAFEANSGDVNTQELACCPEQDEGNSSKEETVVNVANACSMECMLSKYNETDQGISLSRINPISPELSLKTRQINIWIPSAITSKSLSDPQSTHIDSPSIFLVHSSFLI